jgi:hypothetical protein
VAAVTTTTVVAGTQRQDRYYVGPPLRPWRWTSLLLGSIELLAVIWSIPFIILLIGIPIALAAALLAWVGQLAVSLF